MANFHDIVFSIAGSRAAVNEAILLMARNIFESGVELDDDDHYERYDDPAQSFSEYENLIDPWFDMAFAGVEHFDRYLSESAGLSFVDNGPVCSFALDYSCAWCLNEDDIYSFTGALNDLLGPGEKCHVCAVHADEVDGYESIAEMDWDVGPAAALGEDYNALTADELHGLAKELEKDGLGGISDPEQLSYMHAVSCWRD